MVKGETYKTCPELYITTEVFYKEIVKIYNDDCTKMDT